MPSGVYERTLEYRERQRQRMLRPETREKCRQAALNMGPRSAEYRENIRQRQLGKRLSIKTRRKLSERLRERWANPIYREKMLKLLLARRLPGKMTDIECLLRDEFKKRRLKFEMHKPMFGRFQPDFVFESANLIVQADGDYWHSQADGRRRDANFARAASKAGWSVWRFGEQEIKMHAAACAKAVARFIRSH